MLIMLGQAFVGWGSGLALNYLRERNEQRCRQCSEPPQSEPTQSKHRQGETSQSEPPQSKPAHSELLQSEPRQNAQGKSELLQSEPCQNAQGKSELLQSKPCQNAQDQVEHRQTYKTAKPDLATKVVFIAAIVCELSALLVFKYTDFFLNNINMLLQSELSLLALALPLGISFYSFQILSYTIDLYRQKVSVQKNPLYFATYVALFPQLIAGPIVRYADIAEQLTQRKHTLNGFANGIRRFCVGLGKKVLIANTLGQLAQIAQSAITDSEAAIVEQSTLFALLFLVAFTLQIYFDFSGYSDMAIGLGLMFGFKFLENFNYPLIAKSITEFWRRWHMSMSYWFRDYVYIPLGGNRKGKVRHILNILIVWMVTGFWHGAGWNFMGWGLFMALFLLVEKFVFARIQKRIANRESAKISDKKPSRAHTLLSASRVHALLLAFVSHIYLLFVVMLSWILFQSPDMQAATATATALIGMGADGLAGNASLYYLRDYAFPLIIAAIGCTPLPAKLVKMLRSAAASESSFAVVFKVSLTAVEPAFIATMLLLVTAFLVDGTFNPFIYFRF